MKDAIVIWVTLNVIATMVGLTQAWLGEYGTCHKPLNRIEYIIPGSQLGCWLGQAP